MPHLCGLCLALRDGHSQAARTATNYDGLVVPALAAARSETGGGTRTAAPCPLRGMRRAEDAGALVADGDGVYGRAPVRAVARAVSEHWARRARTAGERLGFDSGPPVAVMERQRGRKRGPGRAGTCWR